MKKIALFLTFALALSSVLTAADVAIGGWFASKGEILTNTSAGISDDAKKPVAVPGRHGWGVTFNVLGEGFGATVTLENDSDRDAAVNKVPFWTDGYIHSTFADVFTLYGAMDAKTAISYGPTPLFEGEMYDDAFGLGLGKYNYMSNSKIGKQHSTDAVTGLIGELSVSGFSAALVWNNNIAGVKMEDVVKNLIVINAKYEADGVGTFYAGVAPKQDTAEDNATAFWVSADITAVENLSAAIAYEKTYVDTWWGDAPVNVGVKNAGQYLAVSAITAQLGYDLAPVSLASELSYVMYDRDKTAAVSSSEIYLELQVKPTMIDIVDLALQTKFMIPNADDMTMAYGIGLNVAKSIGNVNNMISIRHNSESVNKDADAVSALTAQYKVTIWF